MLRIISRIPQGSATIIIIECDVDTRILQQRWKSRHFAVFWCDFPLTSALYSANGGRPSTTGQTVSGGKSIVASVASSHRSGPSVGHRPSGPKVFEFFSRSLNERQPVAN